MYKILCCLLVLMLSGAHGMFGRKPPVTPGRLANSVDKVIPVGSARTGITNRRTAFSAHLLAGKVDPGKKYVCSGWVMDRTASLLYPNPYQTQRL